MKRFHFRLQKYLQLKEQKEQLARLELAKARALHLCEMRKLEALQEKANELLVQNRGLLQGTLQPELVALGRGCLKVQEMLAVEQVEAVLQAEERLSQEKQSFIQARKDRKLLERLRQRCWDLYKLESLREEQKKLDEIGTILFCRSQE